MAAILWAGGEDIDFPNGTAVTVNVSTPNYRTGYGRCGIGNSAAASTSSRSVSFPGGAITSGWLHFQANLGAVLFASTQTAGFGLNSAAQFALGIGTSSSSGSKVALWLYSGGTYTQLATETGNSLAANSSNSYDMQVTSFGATATVNVYVNGILLIAYSGSTTVTGVASLDCVAIPGYGSSTLVMVSEIVVTDTLDTRAMSLVTMAPNAAGTTNNWTSGTYASINPTTINDANNIDVNTTGQDFQAALISLPSGTFSIPAVQIAARSQLQAGAVPTGLKLGVNIGGTVYVGSSNVLTNAWATYQRLLAQNPATSAAWLQSAMNSLQLDLQSA